VCFLRKDAKHFSSFSDALILISFTRASLKIIGDLSQKILRRKRSTEMYERVLYDQRWSNATVRERNTGKDENMLGAFLRRKSAFRDRGYYDLSQKRVSR
jgi:hypothetical protein